MFEFTLIKRLSWFVLMTVLGLSAVACTRDKPAESPLLTPAAALTTPEASTPIPLATPLPTSPLVLPTLPPPVFFTPVVISPTVAVQTPVRANTPSILTPIAPVATNVPTAIPTPTITPTVATTSATTYVVQQGEWIYSIARKLGITPQALEAANPGINPNWLVPGQVIKLPSASASSTSTAGGKTHTVKAGETLYSIAVRYGTTSYAIQLKNNLQDPNFLYVGQVLTIP